jgi:hypothetical protein
MVDSTLLTAKTSNSLDRDFMTEIDINEILFIDTESDEQTKEVISIQVLYGDRAHVWSPETAKIKLPPLWQRARAVCAWNAPYDLGVLSSFMGGYEWTESDIPGAGGAWTIIIGQDKYRVKHLGFAKSLISARKRVNGDGISTPVIDLMKLWTILIDSRTPGLKATIRKYLGWEIIQYSETAAKTREYQLQDVYGPRALFEHFLSEISQIPGLKHLSLVDLAGICTDASFTKLAYAAEYPLKEISDAYKSNMHGILPAALDTAYHGGLTISFVRGIVDQVGIVDLSGAYATAIIEYGLERYTTFDWRHITGDEAKQTTLKQNHLVRAWVNYVIWHTEHSGSSLDRLRTPVLTWVWHDDLVALKQFFPDFKYSVEEIIEIIPTFEPARVLPREWRDAKDLEEAEGRKGGTRYNFYKILSNCAYGVRAQREPFPTRLTNLVIAGMITANARRALSGVVEFCCEHELGWFYSDTDSVFTDMSVGLYIDEINERIAPHRVGLEGTYLRAHLIGLKRYVLLKGWDNQGNPVDDSATTHGRWLYDVSEEEFIEIGQIGRVTKDRPLKIRNLAANTERGLKQLLKLSPGITNPHPFMFETNLETTRSLSDFAKDWFWRSDSKTVPPESISPSGTYWRDIQEFADMTEAQQVRANYRKAPPIYDEMGLCSDYDAGLDEICAAALPRTLGREEEEK